MDEFAVFPAEFAFVPKQGLMQDAADWQAELAGAKVRLFKDGEITLTAGTTLAELNAAEADYDGYTALGIEITAFNDPIAIAGNRVAVVGETVQFNYVDGVGHVANDIAGWYLVDTNGVLRGAGMLPDVVTLAGNTDGIAVVPKRIFSN